MYFKPSSLWHSLMAALGNKFNTHKKFFSLLHFTCVSKLLNLSESQFLNSKIDQICKMEQLLCEKKFFLAVPCSLQIVSSLTRD